MYKITRAYHGYGPLTRSQRISGKFAEEPTLLGHTLRRNGPPLLVSEDQYQRFVVPIRQLEVAGAIKVEKIKTEEVAPPAPLVVETTKAVETVEMTEAVKVVDEAKVKVKTAPKAKN